MSTPTYQPPAGVIFTSLPILSSVNSSFPARPTTKNAMAHTRWKIPDEVTEIATALDRGFRYTWIPPKTRGPMAINANKRRSIFPPLCSEKNPNPFTASPDVPVASCIGALISTFNHLLQKIRNDTAAIAPIPPLSIGGETRFPNISTSRPCDSFGSIWVDSPSSRRFSEATLSTAAEGGIDHSFGATRRFELSMPGR